MCYNVCFFVCLFFPLSFDLKPNSFLNLGFWIQRPDFQINVRLHAVSSTVFNSVTVGSCGDAKVYGLWVYQW